MSDEIQRSLGRIEGKIDGLEQAIKQHFEDDKVNFGNIRKDIGNIQKKTWFGAGTVAAAASMVTLWLKGH